MKKTNTRLAFNILINSLIGVLLAYVLGISPILGAVAVNAAGAAMHYLVKAETSLLVGLAQEVWIPLVLDNPYPSASFLQAATNLSSLVNYDKINLAEAGVDPDVLVDNAVYPVPIVDASDTPKDVTLKTYDTKNTVVRNAVAIELAYDQRALYAAKHRNALAKRIGEDAAYMYAPASASAPNNNFIKNLGSGDSIIDAIIDLAKDFRNADADEGMNLVLCPNHEAKMAKEDKVLYKNLIAEPGMEYCGFRIWRYTRNPIYIASTGVKAAYGTAFVDGTHKYSSFAFLTGEVMVADGSVEMFSRLKDPEARGDMFGFQKRALATTLRGKYSGAILQ
ncbi:MAG: hypothetical protein IPH58_05545 [Sphingobacteriales bacterium]|jgi:hypothetical protein|nr:hypothetical protein [Sphingobacteriales bacterium]